MKFLQATATDDNQIEYFNLDRILTIRPLGEKTKILMGAGLYWTVWSDSLSIVEITDTETLLTVLEGE